MPLVDRFFHGDIVNAARAELRGAAGALDEYLALQVEAQEGSASHEAREARHASDSAAALRHVADRLERPATPAELARLAEDVRHARAGLQELVHEADTFVARTGRHASSGVRDTLGVQNHKQSRSRYGAKKS